MDETYPQDLVRHVAASTGLDEATAKRVVADVVSYFGQTVEEFVQQRHGELKDLNKRNDEIWPKIAAEVSARRFRVGTPTDRQLRRIVYR
jgi:hypothetical protein